MKAAELITNAWFLSGIVARDFETPSGSQGKDGLRLLNTLLTDKAITGKKIPYYTQLVIPLVIGQEAYSVANLIEVETITFTLDTVRYSMIELPRKQYFGSARANNVTSLPGNYHVERKLNGANIYVYFLPNQAYPLTVTGKFALTKVNSTQDLNLMLDDFYLNYLVYALAERMCNAYNISLPAQAQQQLNEYNKVLDNVSPLDLTIRKISTLQSAPSLNWAQVNLGRGWSP